jgi:N-acetylmuramoyl-L-alanine amidase
MNISKKTKIAFVFLIMMLMFDAYGQVNNFKVTLDAGHGGKDDGAKYFGNKEKDLTLAVTLKVGKLLEQNPNINLIYTRKTDEFIELRERAKIANRANANLFVSIHCNANKSSAGNGSETYVMGMSRANMNLEVSKTENSVIFLEDNYQKTYKGFDPNKPETLIGLQIVQESNLTGSIDLANKIQNNFSNSIAIKSRGIKQEPLWVLDATTMPGVLIEIGFVSNKIDVSILESEDGQNDIAKAIANAILSYKNENF